MNVTQRCRALLISACASGQGKTTITAALARHYTRQGLQVRVFKTGPDFIDPMILEQASGHPVYQLDLWMVGAEQCRSLLYRAASEADLILVEGVMGLFDGDPSSADLAQHFGLPVLAVIDASAMAQTFAAVAHGLRHYRDHLPFAGVIANRVGSARHAAMLLPAESDITLFASLPRDPAISLPERHLGLHQASELHDLDDKLNRAADALGNLQHELPEVTFAAPEYTSPAALLQGVRIAVARDAAFSFLYQANLDCLREMGAELCFFSPLADTALPDGCDSIYLPGGYPELHLDTLAHNTGMLDSLRAHHVQCKPMLAECGGMLYLLSQLTDTNGHAAALAGLLPGQAQMQTKLSALALQAVGTPEGELRGHSFHYSTMLLDLPPIAQGRCPNGNALQENVYRQQRLTASYIHFYFPSNPAAIAHIFRP